MATITPEECAHGRDYCTFQDDGTQLCVCGAIVATDGKSIYIPIDVPDDQMIGQGWRQVR